MASDVPRATFVDNTSSAEFWKELQRTRIPPVFNNGGGSTLQTIQVCDDEITMACAYIQDISARRNALLSITQLPAEILVSIFRHFLPVLTYENHLDHRIPCRSVTNDIASATRSLIAASHVCRRWRDVVLEAPTLWTILWMDNETWTREMIARSKDAPLTIVHFPAWVDPLHLPHVHRHLPRAHSLGTFELISPLLFRTKQPKYLHLEFNMNGQYNVFEDLLRQPAPSLTTLELIVMSGHTSSTGPYFIPDTLLGGHAPVLTSLTIHGPFSYEALWTSPILRGLVNLTLTAQLVSEQGRNGKMPLHDILEALREMHRLETLHISAPSRCFSQPGSFLFPQSVDDTLRVYLSQLTSLEISGNLRDITQLTRHVSIPPECTMKYSVYLHEKDQTRWPEDFSALVRPAAPLQPIGTIELLHFFTSRGNLHIRCWDREMVEERPRLLLQCCAIPQLHRNQPVDTAQFRESLMHMLDALLLHLDLSHLRELRWARSWPGNPFPVVSLGQQSYLLGQELYLELLGRFKTAERLHFDTIFCPRELLAATGSDASILPYLTSIHIVETHPLSDARVDNTVIGQVLQDLATAFRRLAETHTIQTLEFRGCQIGDEYAAWFEGIATQLLLT